MIQVAENKCLKATKKITVFKSGYKKSYNKNKELNDEKLNAQLELIKEKKPNIFIPKNDFDKFIEKYGSKYMFRKTDANIAVVKTDKYFIIFSYFDNKYYARLLFEYDGTSKEILDSIFGRPKNVNSGDIVEEVYRDNSITTYNRNLHVSTIIPEGETIGIDSSYVTSNLPLPELVEFMIRAKEVLSRGEAIYHNFEKRFPNGKIRLLSEPHKDIKAPLRKLNTLLYKFYGNYGKNCQFAYKKGKCIVDNAIPHKDHKFVFKADIKNFFPSCKRQLVKEVLEERLIKDPNIAEEFLDIILVDDGLCLGNPISPIIATRIVSQASEYLYYMCKNTDIAFSQYCDDLTFSSDRPIAKKFIVDIFNRAYGKYNLLQYFTLKEEKMIGQKGQYRNITGIAFDHTDNNSPTPRRYIYRSLRVAICKYAYGETVNLKKIRGQIAYMFMVGKGERILRYINKFPGLQDSLVSPGLLAKLERAGD